MMMNEKRGWERRYREKEGEKEKEKIERKR